jgi:crotonobetainyl-CoA:carnitine CoA-transferase CaiB-like acyl-CoA transferase
MYPHCGTSTQARRGPALPAMNGDGPLAGYRVLELGSTAAGPFCSRLLGDFGAEVVKIEAIEGDPIRQLGAVVEGKSLYGAAIGRNKAHASFNFRKPAARELAKRVIPKFDVVVENFRPGTLEKWGLGYEDLKKLRPDLVMTRISGFGQSGPYKDRPGYGVIGEAMSGLRHMIGEPDRPPARAAVPLTDYITAVYGAFGTVMAILAREKTGLGQCVDATLIESAFSFMEYFVPAYDKAGIVGKRTGTRLPDSTPNNLYPTRDGHYVQITALADAPFRRLAAVMGRPELGTDPRFAGQRTRFEHQDEIDALISEWTQTQDAETLEKRLHAGDVPASRIFTMADIFRDAHYRAREMLVSVPDDDLGSVTLAGVVPKLSATPGRLRWSGRRIGQDTRAFLREDAGLADAEIDRLVVEGVVYCDPKSEGKTP